MAQKTRLACVYCDTDECDGVAAIPPAWTYVDEVQSYEASLAEVPWDDLTRSPLDWYTHLGVCPECDRIYG